MTIRLNPPYIEGTLPAGYGDKIKVPFRMNSTVKPEQIAGFKIKVRALVNKNNNDSLFTINNLQQETTVEEMIANQLVEFDVNIPDRKRYLKIGQYYKAQMAFISKETDENGNNIIGYYSTVGVFKWTSKGVVEIKELVKGEQNINPITFTGVYRQVEKPLSGNPQDGYYPPDPTERVEQYKFKITNSKGDTIEDTGWLIHDSSQDNSLTESTDTFDFYKEIPQGEVYEILYSVKTNNGVDSYQKYSIASALELPLNNPIPLIAKNNEENGYVELTLKPKEDITIWGSYILLRRDVADLYGWEEMTKFILMGENPSNWSWKDFTVEHGRQYVYAYRQYTDSQSGERQYSEKVISAPIAANFDHAFLWDGERQLKIKFNPKVSSFKTTILESKTDTIGSKYPFIFRNSRISYKDFPIAGLISYWSDDENLFADNDLLLFDDYGKDLDKIRTVNLTDLNFRRERNFKIKVLSWLNDGELKLFRSPSEGNYLVRLMNVSLSPVDTVGRMLHEFSCNAYEMDKINYRNLLKYGFLNTDEEEFQEKRKIMFWASSDISKIYQDNLNSTKTWLPIDLKGHSIKSIQISGMTPGTKIKIDDMILVIGASGNLNLDNLETVKEIFVENSETINSGIITYRYIKSFKNSFSVYNRVEERVVIPYRKIYGSMLDKVSDGSLKRDVIEKITDLKTFITHISYIKFNLTDIETKGYYYKKEGEPTGKIYEDENHSKEVSNLDESIIYKTKNGSHYYWKNTSNSGYGYTSANNSISKIYIDGSELDLKDTGSYLFKTDDDMRKYDVKIDPGINVEIGYIANIVEYIFEVNETDKDTYDANKVYTEAKNALEEAFNLGTGILGAIKAYDEAYSALLDEIQKSLEKYEEEEGGIL